VDRSNVWIVIPAYNEGTVIGQVVRGAETLGHRILVVNDGSTDNTAQQAYEAGATVITHPINLGQGAALATGLEYAVLQQADYIATFDADGQHRIEDLRRMLEILKKENFDIAMGSRFLEKPNNISLRRKIILKGAILITWLTTGVRLTDAHNGLRVMTGEAARKLRITQNGMAHASEIIELLKRHQLRFVEVPVTILYTDYSLRKGQPLSNALNILLELVTGRLGK
jgi:glycosyltransferase involved in cell wall biosynthesis